MSLFEELKRRRVFRLIAAYVVVAWVIIEVANTIEDALNLPAWFDTFIIVSLALGFPIAVIMSWVYDVTPEGVVREDGDSRAIQIDYGKVALGAVLLLGGVLLGNYLGESMERTRSDTNDRSGVQVFEIGVPSELTRVVNSPRTTRITPDGSRIIVFAEEDGQHRLYVRSLSRLDLVAIDGTEGTAPHFTISPDSRSLAFFSIDDGFLKTVSLSGGIATPVADIGLRQDRRADHITWGRGGNIVFTSGGYRGLRQVPSVGGDPVTLTSPDSSVFHKHPSYIPDSDWLVFVIGEGRATSQDLSEEIAFLSPHGEIRMTSLNGSSPRVTSDGRLLYFYRNAIWSVAIDLDDLVVTGESTPIVEDVYYATNAHFDVSSEASLIYVRDSSRGKNHLVWVDRSGNEEKLSIEGARYSFPGISPDGDLIAVVQASPYGPDLWTHSLSSGESTRWTFDEGRESQPIWSPDGEVLYFESTSRRDIYRVAMRGDGVIEQLTDTGEGRWPMAIFPDGRILVDEWGGSTADGNNIGILDPSVGRELTYILQSDFRESHPALSPDGSLLAYMSDSNGTLEIYVRRFPVDDEEVVRVSSSGENWCPLWGANNEELFYWNRNDMMMYSVEISTESGLSSGTPVPLFDTSSYAFEGVNSHAYDPGRDRFLMIKEPMPGAAAYETTLIQNWQELLNDASETP